MNNLIDKCPNVLNGVSANLFLTLINTLILKKCDFDPLKNYPKDYSNQLNNNDEFDFIIIGGGTAGSVIANKLAENKNWKILVLEAGGYPTSISEIPSLLFNTFKSEIDWQYVSEPDSGSCYSFKNKKCYWPRGKCLGGSSSINAMLWLRGNENDYNKWVLMGNPEWDYKSVLEQFKELENFQNTYQLNITKYGTNGRQLLTIYDSKEPIKDVLYQGVEELTGIPRKYGEESIGFFETPQTIYDGHRANSAKQFLISNYNNLYVSLNSHVEKLIFNSNNNRNNVQSIQVKINDKLIQLKARKEFILSAGVIGSPQLLQLSGVGPKNHLETIDGIQIIEDLPVGKNLQDHLGFIGLIIKLDQSIELSYNYLDEIYNYFQYGKGKFSQIGITNIIGLINTKNYSHPYPNLQIFSVMNYKNDQTVYSTFLKGIGGNPILNELFMKINKNNTILNFLLTVVNPKSKGEIKIKSSNPYDHPKIYPNYLSNSDDLSILLEGIRWIQKLIQTKPFKKFNAKIELLQIENCKHYQLDSDNYWLCLIRHMSTSLFHPVGTCRMGSINDKNSVVKSNLKLINFNNLRVIDASIMPSITSVNTMAPTMMIGNYGAKMIINEWKNKKIEL